MYSTCWNKGVSIYMDVSENSGTPKSSIVNRVFHYKLINQPFWGTPIFGNIHTYIYIYIIQYQDRTSQVLKKPPGFHVFPPGFCGLTSLRPLPEVDFSRRTPRILLVLRESPFLGEKKGRRVPWGYWDVRSWYWMMNGYNFIYICLSPL